MIPNFMSYKRSRESSKIHKLKHNRLKVENHMFIVTVFHKLNKNTYNKFAISVCMQLALLNVFYEYI